MLTSAIVFLVEKRDALENQILKTATIPYLTKTILLYLILHWLILVNEAFLPAQITKQNRATFTKMIKTRQ